MKKALTIVASFCLSVLIVAYMPTEVHADQANWTISYNTVWKDTPIVGAANTIQIKNAKVNLDNGDLFYQITVYWPAATGVVRTAPAAAPTGWENETEDTVNGTLSYVVKDNNDAAALEDYIESLEFSGVYGTAAGSIEVDIQDRKITNVYIDPTDKSLHYYEFVENVLTWSEAYNEAKTKTLFGLKGFLATITSEQEHDKIYDEIAQNPGWLGGTRSVNSAGAKFDNPASISANDLVIEPVTTASEWYWACGCEHGDVFYDKATRSNGDSATNNTPYYNWSGTGNGDLEPNNWGGEQKHICSLHGIIANFGTIFQIKLDR